MDQSEDRYTQTSSLEHGAPDWLVTTNEPGKCPFNAIKCGVNHQD